MVATVIHKKLPNKLNNPILRRGRFNNQTTVSGEENTFPVLAANGFLPPARSNRYFSPDNFNPLTVQKKQSSINVLSINSNRKLRP
jgi:hypothetical protein